MANHSAYTPEIAHAILSALRIGCSERDACAGAGLPWRTWCTWKRDVRKGEDRGEGINELVRLVPQAAAQGRNAIAAKINKLAGKDYRAGAWLLEWHEKRNERRARLKLLAAEIELARLKIKAGGVEQHAHSLVASVVVLPELDGDGSVEVEPRPADAGAQEHGE